MLRVCTKPNTQAQHHADVDMEENRVNRTLMEQRWGNNAETTTEVTLVSVSVAVTDTPSPVCSGVTAKNG